MATTVAAVTDAPGAAPEPTADDHSMAIRVFAIVAGLGLVGAIVWTLLPGGASAQPVPPIPPAPPPPTPPPSPPPAPPPPPPAPSCSGTVVYVQPGDTLSGMALAYCGDAGRWSQLCAASGIADCRLIYAGQPICLPAGCLPAAPGTGAPPPPPCNPVFGYTC